MADREHSDFQLWLFEQDKKTLLKVIHYFQDAFPHLWSKDKILVELLAGRIQIMVLYDLFDGLIYNVGTTNIQKWIPYRDRLFKLIQGKDNAQEILKIMEHLHRGRQMYRRKKKAQDKRNEKHNLRLLDEK